MEGLLRVGDGCGGGLVDVVLFCCGDNFEEDLRWEPKLGVFVDLVELDNGLLRVGYGRDDGLVDVVLFYCGDNFEEDLCWEPYLGFSVDLVELDNGVGVTLFKTVEALRGAFFFSTSVELKTKGAGIGGAGREMIDTNTSLPSILTPKHFFAVSVICFERSDLACTCFSGRFLVQSCG